MAIGQPASKVNERAHSFPRYDTNYRLFAKKSSQFDACSQPKCSFLYVHNNTKRRFDYQVLLSYPNYSKPNTIEAKLPGQQTFSLVSNGTAQLLGPPEAIQQENDPRALNWWNGYAKDGVATGQLVYVNYGSLKDYTLLDANNIDLNGRIVLARYLNLTAEYIGNCLRVGWKFIVAVWTKSV